MRALFVAVPAVLLAACGHAEGNASSTSQTVSRTFALADFDQVALRGSDNVHVVVGNSFSVSATGPSDAIDLLEIVVEDGVLKVGRKSASGLRFGWSKKGTQRIRVAVTMPAIRGASLAGSGDMMIDRATADAFKASLAGSGDLKIARLEAKSVGVSVAGPGNIEVAGKVETLDISGAGSGNVAAGGLEAGTARISLAGSGNVDARAVGSASVSVIGSGRATVTGTDNCKTSRMGSGTISCKA